MDYDDPVPDVIVLKGPLTHTVAERLAEEGVSGVKVDASVPASSLVHLAGVPTLSRRIGIGLRRSALTVRELNVKSSGES